MRGLVPLFAARVSLPHLRSARPPVLRACSHRCNSIMASDAPARAADVHIQRLEAGHVAQAAVVVERAFDNEYSWSRPLQMPTERFRFWMANMYLPERAESSSAPASLVATSDAASEPLVAGVCTLEDFYAPEAPVAEADPPPGMRAVDGILHACKDLFHSEAASRGLDVEKGRLGKVAYVAFLAVDSEHRRHRVGRRLVEQAVEQLTARDGFSVVVAFCTSSKSRALFQGAGFQHWGGVSYQEFRIDGSIPFASLPKDECAVLVWTTHNA